MAPLNLFSRRKRIKSGTVDPLIYDAIDRNTRVRIIHEVQAYFRQFDARAINSSSSDYWEDLAKILRRELGVFELPGNPGYIENEEAEVTGYFLWETDIDRVVDCIELFGKEILTSSRQAHWFAEKASHALDSINQWLREANIGYEFVAQEDVAASEMVEISNRVSHAEVILPALHLLADQRFVAANEEFLTALEHLRKQEFGDAISEAAKSLETTLKTIAKDKKWPHDPAKDTLKKLLDIAIKNGGHDTMWQSHFDSARSLLESGLGTARNRLDAHGQGAAPRVVPDYIARFAVHQAAAAILFFSAAAGFK